MSEAWGSLWSLRLILLILKVFNLLLEGSRDLAASFKFTGLEKFSRRL